MSKTPDTSSGNTVDSAATQAVSQACEQALSEIDNLEASLTDPNHAQPMNLAAFDEVLQFLHDGLGQNGDLQERIWNLYPKGPRAALFFFKALADTDKVEEYLLRPLIENANRLKTALNVTAGEFAIAIGGVITAPYFTVENGLDTVLKKLVAGQSVVLIEGTSQALVVTTEGAKERSISEPSIEPVLRGPMAAFIENLDINVAYLRRRLQNPSFRVDYHTVGTTTQTSVAVCSIQGRVPADLLARIRSQIDAVTLDLVPDSGVLSQAMYPSWLHIYPASIGTERPDRVLQSLNDGRVAIIVDGSPFALIYPSQYFDFYQSVADHYAPWAPATLWRLIRLLAAHLSMLLPALYVAATEFHPGTLQPQLALEMSASRTVVPFSPVIEMFLVLILVEFTTEASVRAPKGVGSAVPIVGGIIIGNVLAQTHLAGPIALVTGALSGIAQFTVGEPSIQMTLRAEKFWNLFWANWLGLFGIIIGASLQLSYLSVIESAGFPYFAPIAPFRPWEALDAKFALPPKWRPNSPIGGNK